MGLVHTIPPTIPFLKDLAAGVIARYGHSPTLLCDVTIWLPTRRSCRALHHAFLEATHNKPIILPTIQALSMVDEEALFLQAPEFPLTLSDPMSKSAQLILIARLIHAKEKQKNESATFSHAMQLATTLTDLLAEMQTEEVSFDALHSIIPETLSEYWQDISTFLELVLEYWPLVCADKNECDAATYQQQLLQHQIDQWNKTPTTKPVIAAGSLGTVPVIARFLEAVFHLPGGHVILPYVDHIMADSTWEHFKTVDETIIGHPQYAVYQALQRLGLSRDSISPWHQDTQPDASSAFISQIMQPAICTHQWHVQKNEAPTHHPSLDIIECDSLSKEAHIIAMLLRETLETPEKKAALITHHQGLAIQVESILHRWGITIDNSAGTPLWQTTTGRFFFLIAQMVSKRFSPIELLAALKHPLMAMGYNPLTLKQLIRSLESTIRHMPPYTSLEELLTHITADISPDVHAYLLQLQALCKPLAQHIRAKNVMLSDILSTHITLAESLASTEENQGSKTLWKAQDGGPLQLLFEQMITTSQTAGPIRGTDYLRILEILLKKSTYRPQRKYHPRLAILGPLEARLLHFDRVILGELNEGSWPSASTKDPWMNRTIRQAIGLPLPEKRIGQSAHDFCSFLHSQEVIITRAEKIDGTPTMSSRWLTRLYTFLGQEKDSLFNNAAIWKERADQFHLPTEYTPIAPPEPQPPVSCRPTTLSVTAIEKWLSDPYSIYAQHILKLKPLSPLTQEAEPKDFGILVHHILDIAARCSPNMSSDALYDFMVDAIKKELKKHPECYSTWWPRLRDIAHWYSEWEKTHCTDIETTLTEARGLLTIPVHNQQQSREVFTLKGTADRIDYHKNGSATIIDYKTGTLPTQKQIAAGLKSQLILEAFMLQQSGFGEKAETSDILYLRTSGRKGTFNHLALDEKTTERYVEEAKTGLKQLIHHFEDEQTPYLSCPRQGQNNYNDYLHLARWKEWKDRI